MIHPAISRHARTRDVLHTLEVGLRPGSAAPQLLDCWDEDRRIGPFDTDQLAHDLDHHLRRFTPPRPAPRVSRLVWQCVLRADLTGPGLTGTRLAQLGRDVLHATGIARADGIDNCRWALIRIDSHEARLVAPLVTASGQVLDTTASRPLALAVCQLADRRQLQPVTTSALRTAPALTGRRR